MAARRGARTRPERNRSMSKVRFEHHLKLPPSLVRAALAEILASIATGADVWRDFTFHVDLRAAHLPDVGYIAIPIHLTLAPAREGIDQLDIQIASAKRHASFPTFHGAMGVDATNADSSESMLWLAGDYDLPMHALGVFVDATLAAGIAQLCLSNFLDDVAQACAARIEKRENDFVRYRHYGQ